MSGPASAQRPPVADELAVLSRGDITLSGRVLPASNLTFVGEVSLRGQSLRCVYKPVAGERPLWDFPDGTLAAREVAAYQVSEALGWGIVPRTVMRDGPAGPGMVQVWREPDPGQDPVDLVAVGRMPPGFLHVLDAVDGDERPVSLIHEDSVALRRMAVFDVLVNNADRKGGHVLPMPDGHRYGVDHGVCFHVDNKLRTILWGWADLPVETEDARAVAALAADLRDTDGELVPRLRELLDGSELRALRTRCERLLTRGRMPVPSGGWPAIPWPAF
jgi:uncharacterized repeat protein (TIGR03843 family)